jgi:predicted Zn-dependent peptidase
MIQPDRTQAPPFQLSSDYSLTQPEVFTFSGGQPLYAFRGLAQQVIKLELIFHAGKWYEPHSGLSYFTAQMLRKGTLKRSSFQIASAFDSLGAHLDIVAGFDTVTVSLFVLSKNFGASFDILLEILRTPAFDENELRLEKEIFVQNLRVNNEKTNVVASKEIRKRIFGISHPYGNSTEESDIKGINQDGLRGFFEQNFTLRAAYLVGPISDLQIGDILSAVGISDPKAAANAVPEAKVGASHKLIKPGSVQASIRMGKRCLTKQCNEEYFDALMFNHILGGYFGSRLMKNIREEKGLTYGIHSGMNHFFNGSFWVISAEVNQQNADEAISEIKNEIRRLQEELVPTDELEVARNYFIGSWQSDNSTLFAVAEKVRNIHEYHLPADYYDQMLGHFQQITPEQIQRVAQAYFGAGDLVEVQVG